MSSLQFSSFHFKLTDVAGRTGILNILPFASTFHALPWHLLRGRFIQIDSIAFEVLGGSTHC